jgi:uncharacterized protein
VPPPCGLAENDNWPYHRLMRYLVDGNNLMFALAEVGIGADREQLGRLLGEFANRQGTDVTVVFDGPAPRGPPADRCGADISAYYSGGRTADDVLADLVNSYSAPRNLTVVSGDRAVQRQAKRRGCKIIEALAFARLLKASARGPAKAADDEPAAKREGLSKGQVDRWLKEFGLDDHDNSGWEQ